MKAVTNEQQNERIKIRRELKKELKKWEQEFELTNGSKPTKQDISLQKEIATKYKLYAKIKSAEINMGDLNVDFIMSQAFDTSNYVKSAILKENPSVKGNTTNILSNESSPNTINTINTMVQSKEIDTVIKDISLIDLQPKQQSIHSNIINPLIESTLIDHSIHSKDINNLIFEIPKNHPTKSFILQHSDISIQKDYLTHALQSTEIQNLINRKKELEFIFNPTTKQSDKIIQDVIVDMGSYEIETIELPADIIKPRVAFLDEKEIEKEVIVTPLDTKVSQIIQPFGELGLGSSIHTIPIYNPKFFLRIPQNQILRCRLYRKKTLLDKAHPTFFLYNEADDKFLLSARRRLKTKSLTYLISTSPDDMSKVNRANSSRTNFILYDARSYKLTAVDKGLRELACISYTKTVLPRELSVAIANTKIPEDAYDQTSKDIMTDVKSQTVSTLTFLRNKTPRWNETTQSHCLNFGGRVTQPSIKNFQLIQDGAESVLVMQFGRCGTDLFTLDLRYPLRPIEAFAVALTTFHAYDSA